MKMLFLKILMQYMNYGNSKELNGEKNDILSVFLLNTILCPVYKKTTNPYELTIRACGV